MRQAYMDCLNPLTSGFVRFDAPPAGGSLVVLDQTPYAIYVNVPADYNVTRSPTKALFDRLSELKTKYSTISLLNSTLPSENAFQNARDFVLTLPLNRIDEPSIHVASDGEVNFQWSGPDFHIDLGFYGNEKFSFFATKDGRDPIVGDNVLVKEGIPESLVDFVSAA